jgi:hypothetical protein
MSKFLNLVEEFDPQNTTDPKWELIDFLKSKGVPVSLIRGTDMVYIDTGSKTIAVTISNNEEDESINAGTGTYQVDQEVEKLGQQASTGLKGLMAKSLGTAAQQAKSATKKRQKLAGKAVQTYEKGTKALEDALKNSNRPTPIITTY